jgi:hypothetical protein
MRQRNNSLNPAWDTAVAHLLVQDSWPAGTPSTKTAPIIEEVRQAAAELRKLAPDSGQYINEVFT